MHVRKKSVPATTFSILGDPVRLAVMNKIMHKIRLLIVVFYDEHCFRS